jgi:superfamily II DNA or RNA helicase
MMNSDLINYDSNISSDSNTIDDNIPDVSENEKAKFIQEMKTTYTYPEQSDKNIQMKLYIKPEFYYNKIPYRKELTKYEDIDKFRTDTCVKKKGLREHQNMLANFINPNTPFTGVLCFHGLGSGKTCVGIAIGETFKNQVKKYNTKIFILVPSVLSREQWYKEIIVCTKDTYLKSDSEDKEKQTKDALLQIKEYYKIMTHTSFRNHVLGDRIVDDKVDNKNVYKKNTDGEYERDISGNEISNLNNSILIIDEIHNFTGNTFGEALIKIIKKSVNLKLVLLTATPMKNFADDIIELINYLRPQNDQINKNKVFDNIGSQDEIFSPNGEKYLANMISGYVSYIRGGDPLVYATRVDVGENVPELLMTKVIRCKMSNFQQNIYIENIAELEGDSNKINIEQSSKTSSIANFIFPILNTDNKINGAYGINGLNTILDQIENDNENLNKHLSKFLNIPYSNDIITKAREHKSISGKLLHISNLRQFAVKFHTCLTNINDLVEGKKGAKNAFVYSNVVKIGIELFSQILNMNGYLPYQDDINSYQISDDTRCYYCGGVSKNHTTKHKFYPATYILITGKGSDDIIEIIPEKSKYILDHVFNNISNKDGKYIKFVLGSKVMNEGINLKNIGEIHILDVSYNFKTVDQTVGRGIRWCSHYDVMSKDNLYPEVLVYKYTVSFNNSDKLTIEDELYKRAEHKYLLIKKVERILKENAIDCPLNYSANIIHSDVEKFKDCIEPKFGDSYNANYCPAECDYTKCAFECTDTKLNLSFYDKTKHIYQLIDKDKLDYSTFTRDLAITEINFIKQHVKDMYIVKYLYSIDEFKSAIKQIYKINNRELYDDFFLYKALDELIPITENDFNNFNDVIYDKYNRQGYLIYIDKYYIYQPFYDAQTIPMYYRTMFNKPIQPEVSLYNYLKSNYSNVLSNDIKITSLKSVEYIYDMDYYDNKNEYDLVGIMDNKNGVDVFKIRPKRNRNNVKKRELGLPTLKGSVCWNSKTSHELDVILRKLDIKKENNNRKDICSSIEQKLLALEKSGNGKTTYMMIPKNHSVYKFPYNLEDRKKYISDRFKDNKIIVEKTVIKIPNNKLSDEQNKLIEYYNGTLKNNTYEINII